MRWSRLRCNDKRKHWMLAHIQILSDVEWEPLQAYSWSNELPQHIACVFLFHFIRDQLIMHYFSFCRLANYMCATVQKTRQIAKRLVRPTYTTPNSKQVVIERYYWRLAVIFFSICVSATAWMKSLNEFCIVFIFIAHGACCCFVFQAIN